jgi:hypothetical protein
MQTHIKEVVFPRGESDPFMGWLAVSAGPAVRWPAIAQLLDSSIANDRTLLYSFRER